MQQTSYRSSLGGTTLRPPLRLPMSGINSRVQDTAYLLSHVARPASATATPSRRFRTRRQYGHPGAFSGINSRVQDTAWILSHAAYPAPATAYPSGMGNLSWLGQGIALALGAEWINRFIQEDPTVTALEREVKIQEAVQKLNQLNYGESKGIVGNDRYVTVFDRPAYASPLTARAGLGDAYDVTAEVGLPIASTAIASGTSLASSATWLAAAGGPIGLAVVGVTTALTLLFSRKKPKQKVATTEIVNSVEPYLQQNLSGYMAGPHTTSSQAQALANFDAGWKYVVDNCKTPEMGTPGKWCVEDRQAGGKWDWFARYRDPIANDPDVTPDHVAAQVNPVTGQVTYPTAAGSGASILPLVIAGALALVAFQM